MNPTQEPTRLASLVNAALIATLGILTVTEVLSPEVAGSIGIALAAWVAAVGEFIRTRVTPVDNPSLTPVQYANVHIKPEE